MQTTSASNVLFLALNTTKSVFKVSCTRCEWNTRINDLNHLPEQCPCCTHHVLQVDSDAASSPPDSSDYEPAQPLFTATFA